MTDAPVALTQLPQFTAEHWQKVPRSVAQQVIDHVTNKGEYVEIVLKGGVAFQRKRSEIQQLLTANLQVNIEFIGSQQEGQLVTGLFVPGIGWAFRMTNDDLAEYAKKVYASEGERRKTLKERMIDVVATALLPTLKDMGLKFDVGGGLDEVLEKQAAHTLAAIAVNALERGPQ